MCIARGFGSMPPEQDARAILRLALRHEQSLAVSLNPAFAQENWGFLAQQCVENLLKGLIVLAGDQPPLTHDLERLELPVELLDLQEFAVKARYSPEETPLSGSRQELLARISQLRMVLEEQLEAAEGPLR
jgi:HEPN domain-containing protein